MKTEDVKIICQKKLKEGKEQKEIIKFMHDSGLTITESMKIFMDLFEVSLAESKSIVASHPIWNSIVKASSVLHEDLAKEIKS